MRSRYRIHEPQAAHFVTSTVVAWLPVFTTAARCDLLIQSWLHCREHKGLRIHGWVILDNHFHAVLSAPDLMQVMRDFKRHTARQILNLLQTRTANGCCISSSISTRCIKCKASGRCGRRAFIRWRSRTMR